jgi:ureidoacrylate peracid hydrolase
MNTKLQPNETAVIVLDMQNDFCDSEGAFKQVLGRDPSAIQEMAERLEAFLNEVREQGCKIIFSQMMNDAEESPDNLRERLTAGVESDASEWPFGLKKGSWGYELYKLKPEKGDEVLEKKYFDFFSNPELKKHLEKSEIKNLVISGVYAEMCVLSTASRGFTEGYRIVVSKDLIATTPDKEKLKELVQELMAGYCAEVVESKEITAELRGETKEEVDREVRASKLR